MSSAQSRPITASNVRERILTSTSAAAVLAPRSRLKSVTEAILRDCLQTRRDEKQFRRQAFELIKSKRRNDESLLDSIKTKIASSVLGDIITSILTRSALARSLVKIVRTCCRPVIDVAAVCGRPFLRACASIFRHTLSLLNAGKGLALSKTPSLDDSTILTITPLLADSDSPRDFVDVENLQFWGEGGYHHVLRVKFRSNGSCSQELQAFPDHIPDEVIVRIHKEEAFTDMTPTYLRNEVGMRMFLAKQDIGVPNPRIYAWDDTSYLGLPYTVEELVKGQSMDAAWQTYTADERAKALKNLGHMLFNLASPEFSHIGALDPVTYGIVPHAEPAMEVDGRSEVYDSGMVVPRPYWTGQEYVLAMYGKEIAYYESDHPLDPAWSQDSTAYYGSPARFAKFLRRKREQIARATDQFSCMESFRISHCDLSGRNILVDGTTITALLDFEFCAILPASQFFRQMAPNEPHLQLFYGPLQPKSNDQAEWDAYEDARARYHEDNNEALAVVKRHMRERACEEGWSKSSIGYLLDGWGSKETSRVQWPFYPDDAEYQKERAPEQDEDDTQLLEGETLPCSPNTELPNGQGFPAMEQSAHASQASDPSSPFSDSIASGQVTEAPTTSQESHTPPSMSANNMEGNPADVHTAEHVLETCSEELDVEVIGTPATSDVEAARKQYKHNKRKREQKKRAKERKKLLVTN